MAPRYTKPAAPTPFDSFKPDDWYNTDAPMEQMQPANQFSVGNEETMDLMQPKSSFSVGNAPAPSTDWSGVAGAGVGAAGQMAGMLAQVAGQKYAMDQAAQQGDMNRALTSKLAKMQLAANQDQFARDQNLRGLLATLSANRGAIDTLGGGRNIRQSALEGMDQLLSKVMLRRG